MNAAPRTAANPSARLPRVARSAAFGVFFVSALVLTVLGALLSFSSNPAQVELAYNLLRANLLLILLIAVYLCYRVYVNLFAPSHGGAAPLLHRRFVIIFSLAALLPAIIIGAFSASLISQNVSALFGSDVRGNMDVAQRVLTDYRNQALSDLASDADIARNSLATREGGLADRITLVADLQILSRVRDLDALIVLRDTGEVLAEAISPRAPDFEVPRPDLLAAVGTERAVYLNNDETNYLIALRRLAEGGDTVLYVGRRLSTASEVLSNMQSIEAAKARIDTFTRSQSRLNAVFALTFVETALLLLVAAVWLGLVLANRIIEPLSSLIDAAERVRAGDMGARVRVSGEWGEISDLGSAFNRMTQQIGSQRDELVREHEVSEQRRQFSEAVLSGVRAGVIGLTEKGRVTLMNASAERLLGLSGDAALDRPITEVLPEFAPAFGRARDSVTNTAEDQITYSRDGETVNIDLRIAAYQGARRDTGWVVTFDDMTRLVAAQRHGAWREVARRIAHEIKNPLTPIQLSAERLSRKYGRVLTEDREVFDNCTQTIIRQVGSLERMVDEFSAFARMPRPEMEALDMVDVLGDVLFEQGVAAPDIRFTRRGDWPQALGVRGDERLLMQALSNVYKNATEAVLRVADEAPIGYAGRVETELRRRADQVSIVITDNGPGFPQSGVERLLEPYVTTRDEGTGLGLPIVKRIIEDHGGTLVLQGRDDGRPGAQVVLTLPLSDASTLQFTPREAAE